jgi:nucleotide-binding universal stress UspA family protein
MVSGHAGRGIVEYADANDVDCIIIASHRPGLQNLFLGSTANRVVHHAKCTVHVLR